MTLLKTLKYSYNDISIVPSVITDICHRSECNPFIDGKLPLFTAPMSSVVDEHNFDLFERQGINAILPRTTDLELRISFASKGKWAAFGINEFHDAFIKKTVQGKKIKALIDVANGHMSKVISLVKDFKEKYKVCENEIMVGNIANPLTYTEFAKVGADYIRCGIGGGEGCLTTSNTAVHYPMASLIDETFELKKLVKEQSEKGTISVKSIPKIIADGGVRNYSDAIKALALGADYVMIGGLFARMVESAAEPFMKVGTSYRKVQMKDFHEYNVVQCCDGWKMVKVDDKTHVEYYPKLFKPFFGMASKKAQRLMHVEKTRTSEGLDKIVEVKYTLGQWVDNFIDYMRSAMSYTNHRTLNDFISNTTTTIISNNCYMSVNK